MAKFLFTLLFIGASVPLLLSQEKVLNFGLYSADDKSPIGDAHVFISNTSIGSISNPSGQLTLSIPDHSMGDIILSHVSYHVHILESKDYHQMGNGDSIFLSPNSFDPSLLVISGKRNRKWKKHLKRFKKALFGEGPEASKCEILNPQVLRFENKNKSFRATAVDMLQIKNDHLGYDLSFLLSALTIDKEGSMKYSGRAKFTEQEDIKNIQNVLKRRKEAFERSPQHFFLALVDNRLDEAGYELSIRNYAKGAFTTIMKPIRDDILIVDSLTGEYHLQFPEYLQITNRNVKEITEREQPHIGRRSRYNTTVVGQNVTADFVVSLLYKLAPYLIVTEQGHIVNHKMVQEYGFWAKQRVAVTLPRDYNYKVHYLE